MTKHSGITLEGEYTVIGGAKGGGGSAPRQPVIQPDSIRSLAIIEIVEALGEGEIQGFATADPLESIYLDDTPIKSGGNLNFPGVSLAYRTGTQSQTYMQGSLDNTTAALVPVGVAITHSTPLIRRIDDITVDAVRITLLFSALMSVNSSTGDRVGTRVQIAIEVSLDLGVSWLPADLQGRHIISGKTESSYERTYTINLRSFGDSETYDIRVSRVSPDPDPNTTSDFQWESFSKLSFAKLRYPNTAVVRLTFDAKSFDTIPKRSYLVKGIKVRVPGPTAYNAAARTYTGADWDGNFVTAWTRCPAWIFYDIITNPRYGLGELINPAYQDKWTLYTIAQRCDELIQDGFGGQEHRYSLDLVLAEAADAKQVIMDIASAFDSMAYWGNKAIKVTQDAPKAVSALFVPGNVAKGVFTYAGSARQVRYTASLVQWNDPEDQYRIATEYVDDQTGITRYGYREKQIASIGCTSRGQAHRAGKRILLTSRLETDVVSFSVGLDGLTADIGQVIRIADPLRAGLKRQGGRVLPGSTASSVLLDAPVILSAGIAYKLAVIKADGTVIESLVSNTAGTHSTITLSPALSAAPVADTAWIVYDPNAANRLYRIVGITEIEGEDKTDGFYSITAVQYNALKYTLLDQLGALPAIPVNPFLQNSVIPPSGIQFSSGVYLSSQGIRRYIDVWWSASTDPFLRGYRIVIRHESRLVTDKEIAEQSYRIQNPSEGTWSVTLQAVSSLGKYSTSITVDYELGQLYLVESVSITGLILIGGGTNFSGRAPEFDWDTDALTVLGFSDTFGVGSGGQSPWFRDYQVDIYNGATLLRSDFVTESRYTYSYEKNLEDGGPRRTITVKVRARDMFGMYSQMAQLIVSNPLPAAINTVNVYTGVEALIINYLRPADNDWVGVIVFLSTVSGFVPAEANKVYVGGDTTITIPNLLEDVPYFIRIAAYDAFYDTVTWNTDYTLSATEYTKTIPSVLLPTPEEIKTGLQNALNNPTATPLVFEADIFAIKLEGIDKTPFILGSYQGNPALLLDSDVIVTGNLSADQLIGGRIAATEDIIIGNGNARINGDGSIIVYNGDDTVSNRDFAILSGATLSFQRFRGGEYLEYKSVRRAENGVAPSGTTVTLPGYWDAQPVIIPSLSSVRGYDAANSNSSQTWTVRADNLREIPIEGTVLVDTQIELVLQGNATLGGSSASKTAGAENTWDQQAYSTIGTDQDCWVSWKFNSNTEAAMCSLNSDPQNNASYNTLDYAIFGDISGTAGIIRIYENGIQKGAGYGSYTSSDVFKIERVGTMINYLKNGVLFASSVIAAGTILFVDSSFYGIGAGINTMQFWHKQAPPGSGSGRWMFDAVAELNYASNAGNTVVASTSGTLAVNGWTSAESILPNGTVSVTVTARFSSYRGNGTSTYGFLYRSISWTVQGWNGGAWINLATKVRNITAAEHAQQLVDTQSLNIATTVTKVRCVFTAYDTNGTSYSRGANTYNYQTVSVPVEPATGKTSLAPGTFTVTTASWTPPAGWSIYAMRYVATFHAENFGGTAGTDRFYAEGVAVWTPFSSGFSSQVFDYDSGQIAKTSYNRTYFSYFLHGNGYADCIPSNYTAYLRKVVLNSTTPVNNFIFQEYAWNIAGSTMIAAGSINWLAMGD